MGPESRKYFKISRREKKQYFEKYNPLPVVGTEIIGNAHDVLGPKMVKLAFQFNQVRVPLW